MRIASRATRTRALADVVKSASSASPMRDVHPKDRMALVGRGVRDRGYEAIEGPSHCRVGLRQALGGQDEGVADGRSLLVGDSAVCGGGRGRRRPGGGTGAGLILAMSAMSLSSQASCFSLHGGAGGSPFVRPRAACSTPPTSTTSRPPCTPPVRSLSQRAVSAVKMGEGSVVDLGRMEELIAYLPGSKEWDICAALLRSIAAGGDDEGQRTSQLEQGSEQWLSARKHRLTASNFGAAANRNPFMKPQQLAQEMLVSTFKGNDATRWGSEHENIARDSYILERKAIIAADKGVSVEEVEVTVKESGLHIWKDLPFLAVSPDGHVSEDGETGLLEIKCPASKKIYPKIPDYYMDQMQGIMAILGYEWADFVVWTPEEQQIKRVPFDKEYWDTSLLPALKTFYRDIFLPAYVASVLSPPSLTPPQQPSTLNGTPQPPLKQQPPPTPPSPAAARPKPVISSVSIIPLPTTPALPPLFDSSGVLPSPPQASPLVKELLQLVIQLDMTLKSEGFRPEFVGSDKMSLYYALAIQLHRLGVVVKGGDAEVATVDGVPLVRVGDARVIKDRIAMHIAVNAKRFEKLTGKSGKLLRSQLVGVAEGRQSPGSAELMGAAELFNINIKCYIIANGLKERIFSPASGSDDAPVIHICTTTTFFWSTSPRPDGKTRSAQATLPKAAARGGGDGEEFSSKFSFAFQECVCSEEARKVQEGKSDIDSLKEAFQHCNEKLGEMKLAANAGSAYTPEQEQTILQEYAALLEKHRGTIQGELERKEGGREA